MITNTECALQGQFKVDIYNKENHLVDTTDWFNNYITNTGLFYPLTYPFADCFRFLSLGSSSSANTDATTGLVNPMSFNNKFSVLDEDGSPAGFQYVSHWGKEAYHAAGPPPDYATPGSCGAQHHKTGPLLFRGWNVPSGNFYVSKNLNINEFAVSPSSGADPLGSKAFSRIVKPIMIPSGTRSIISYRLKLAIDSGIKTFGSGTFSIAGADTSEGSTILNTLGNLSGYYRQVYHGFRLVDNQGRTYIPKYGEAMEPSCKDLDKLSLYLSPAYSQFSANPLGGAGFPGSIYLATSDSGLYPPSYGHAIINIRSVGSEDEFYSLNQLEQSTIPEEKINVSGTPAYTYLLKNIRLKSDDNPYSKIPSLHDYRSGISFDFTESLFENPSMALATQGDQGYNDSYLNQGFKCSFSADISNLKFNKAEQTGRAKTFTRKATFSPVNNFDWNTRYGAMVYAYRNGNDFYPVIDTLFYDSAGRSFRLDNYSDVNFAPVGGNQVIHFYYQVSNAYGLLGQFQYPSPGYFGKEQGIIVNSGPGTDKSITFNSTARPVPSKASVSIMGGATFRSPGGFQVSDPGFNAQNQLIDYIAPQPILLDSEVFHSATNYPGSHFRENNVSVPPHYFPGIFRDNQYKFYHESGAFSRGEVANYDGQNWACIKNVPETLEDIFVFTGDSKLLPTGYNAADDPKAFILDNETGNPTLYLKRGSAYDFSYQLRARFTPSTSGMGGYVGTPKLCFFSDDVLTGRYPREVEVSGEQTLSGLMATPVDIGKIFVNVSSPIGFSNFNYDINNLHGLVRHDALPSVSQLKYGFEMVGMAGSDASISFLNHRFVLGTVILLDYPGVLGPTGNTGHWMFLNNESAIPAVGTDMGTPVVTFTSGMSGDLVNTYPQSTFQIESTAGLYIVYKSGTELLPFSGNQAINNNMGNIRLSGCASGSGIFPVNFTTHQISRVDILTGLPYEHGQREFKDFIPNTVFRVTDIHMNTLAERGYGKGWATNEFTSYTYSGNYHAATGETGIPIGVALVETVARTWRHAIPFGGKLTFNRRGSLSMPPYTYVFGEEPKGNISWTNFQQPSGVLVGSLPSYRTLPNHGLFIQDNEAYPLGVAGAGHYPGLSSLNSLDVYLTTTWSA